MPDTKRWTVHIKWLHADGNVEDKQLSVDEWRDLENDMVIDVRLTYNR